MCSDIRLDSSDMSLCFSYMSYDVDCYFVIYVYRLRKSGLKINTAEFGHAYIRMDKMEEFDSPRWYRYVFVHLAETHYFAKMWKKMEVAAARYSIPRVSHVAPGLIAGHNYTISL